LQIQQLHDDFAGVAIEYFALEQNNAIFQQQIAQREHALPLIIAIIELRVDRRKKLIRRY
jgi:hypothetical protein